MEPIILDSIEYTVEVWDINDVFVADISHLIATSLRINFQLNDVEQIDFAIDLVQFENLCASIGARPLNIIEPYRTDIKIRRNGKYLLGAHVIRTNVNLNNTDTNKLEVTCTGYLNHLKDRYLTVRYENKTYAQIARQLITDTQSAQNLIENGKFWEGIDGWIYQDSGFIIWDAAQGYDNLGSLFVSVTTGPNTFGGARWQRAMQAGLVYTLTFRVKGTTGVGSIYVRTDTSFPSGTTALTTSWQQVSITFTQPTNTSYLDIMSSGSENFWIDDVKLSDNIDSSANRDFGITLGTDYASATQQADRIRNYDLQSVKDAIINLTKLENDNFDFAFDANKVFTTWSRKGSDKPGVELVYPQNIESMTTTRDAQTLYNKVIGLGSGIGEERLEASVLDQVSAITYRVRETVQMFNSVELMSTLTANTFGVLDQSKEIHDNIVVKVTNNVLDLDDVEIGDAIYIRVDGSTYIDYVNGLYRIVGMDINVSREFEESITLELKKWD
jgi:carbohydrate binding protein with CBM4/9 domain